MCGVQVKKKSKQAEGRLKVGFKLDSQTIQCGRANPVCSVLPIMLPVLAQS